MTTANSAEKEEYINKLTSQISAIGQILEMDGGSVISPEIFSELQNVKKEAETVRRKLVKNEFEVAIVGLEKAGKSTFGNAFMENKLLPSKEARCTFTSTKIDYTENDSATVSFYDVNTFNNDFRDKLGKLKFPDYSRYSFDNLSESVYLRVYEEKVDSTIKKAYGDSIHQDVLAIIQNASSIRSMLGKPSITFDDEQVNSGILEHYITDEDKARAVSEVVIHSSKLKSMQNAIIYDVPGFNSPTDLHKAQTKHRMSEADAIIVVASGAEPSITGETLSILKESDPDGNPLSDKLFVYANKIDRARDIAENIKTTYREWTSRGFVSNAKCEERIVFGSALAHLQSLGLDIEQDDQALRNFNDKKDKLPHGDGVDHIRKALERYNENERFEVLKRRINRLKTKILDIFGNVKTELSDEGFEKANDQRLADCVGYVTETSKNLVEALKVLREQIIDEINETKPLSNKITEYIQENVTVENYEISDEEFAKIKRDSKFDNTVSQTLDIEFAARKRRFESMYNDFSKNIIHIADGHHKEYASKILTLFLDNMDVHADSPFREPIEENVKKVLMNFRHEMLGDASADSSGVYYQSLIERFSRDIYQVLIMCPYNSERLRTFYEAIDNFFSISVFYRKPGQNDKAYVNIPPKDQPLCRMLLFHNCDGKNNMLQGVMTAVQQASGLKNVAGVKELLERAFFAVGGNQALIVSVVADAISKMENFLSSDSDRMEVVKKALDGVVKRNESYSVADENSFTGYYKDFHAKIYGNKLYGLADVREEFNKDVEILQDVLLNAFVRAIRMEKPFIAREAKSIDDIIAYVEGKEFGSFLSANYSSIKYEETQEYKRKERQRMQDVQIMAAIDSILATLN